MSRSANHLPHWTLLWLRQGPGLAAIRKDIARHGGQLLALCPWRIVPIQRPDTRAALLQALQCRHIIFTSPAAVSAANTLVPLHHWQGSGHVLAVGAGTMRALQAVGLNNVLAPQRMDSEGLLGLPQLQNVSDTPLGLVTAPEGRGVIPATLLQRGARLHLAEVYLRRRRHIPARQRARLRTMAWPAWLALGSGKALEQLWEQLSEKQRQALRQCRTIPASQRLAVLAANMGMPIGPQASSAMAQALLEAVNGDRLAQSPALAELDRSVDA